MAKTGQEQIQYTVLIYCFVINHFSVNSLTIKSQKLTFLYDREVRNIPTNVIVPLFLGIARICTEIHIVIIYVATEVSF